MPPSPTFCFHKARPFDMLTLAAEFGSSSLYRQSMPLNFGGIPPAWNDTTLAVANFKYGRITTLDVPTLAAKIQEGFDAAENKRKRLTRTLVSVLSTRANVRWQSHLDHSAEFEPLSVALAPNAELVEWWKEPEHGEASSARVTEFLNQHGGN